ncbi:MAG: WbqC family protein [Butyrivibrio sp.]|nr:WbqC family protein [Butyrivibrio sp.]
MKLGIMQPYFFPYLGYWQLMDAVNEYLIIDDVNYIKNGYINRNKILVNGEPFNFGIPVRKASQNNLIREHEQGLDEEGVHKLLATLKSAYAKAPFFQETYDHVREVLEFGLTDEGRNLADFLDNANRLTAKKLGITTPIYRTSRDVKLDGEYKRENLVVAICRKRNADEYYNAIGGECLYCQAFFRSKGIGLKFVKMNEDIPKLSIIDIMMNNDSDRIKELLSCYTLEDGLESFEKNE